MSAEFQIHRGRAWLGVALTLGFAAICLISTLGATGLWPIFATVFSIALLGATAHGIRWLLHKGPILVISAEGLYFAPFANHPAPWNEITAITRILSFGRTQFLSKVTWTRAPSGDQLNFAVADYRGYPNDVLRAISRSAQNMGGLPPIAIQLGIVDGDSDAIVAEIKKHWRGEVAVYDPRPLDQR